MSSNHRSLFVSSDAAVREVCRVIDQNPVKIALIVDDVGRLLGTVTDGDIRRGLLRGVGLEDPARSIMHERPIAAPAETPREELVFIMRENQVAHLPLIDEEGRVVGVETISDVGLAAEPLENPVVIFAGGMGRRLSPLTDRTPKPMLPVGGRPLLEIILERVTAYGFRRFLVAVHHMEDQIVRGIGDGSRFGARVSYLRESEPLGTAGALRLAREHLDRDFLVMNADLLTSLDLTRLLSFHLQGGQKVTLAAREHIYRVPFGVLQLKSEVVTDFIEKPASTQFIYAGVAALHPDVLKNVPEKGAFDMPDLIRATLSAGDRIVAFPVHEAWLDIGRMEDYRKALDGAPETPGGKP